MKNKRNDNHLSALRVEAEALKTDLGNTLRGYLTGFRAIRISKHQHVYTAGDTDDSVYFIESGSIELFWPAPQGCRGPATTYSAGDLFGESFLAEQTERLETVMAVEDSCILHIPRDAFMTMLESESLLVPMAQLLAIRIADRQQTIAALLATSTEQVLAQGLSHSGRQTGRHKSQ